MTTDGRNGVHKTLEEILRLQRQYGVDIGEIKVTQRHMARDIEHVKADQSLMRVELQDHGKAIGVLAQRLDDRNEMCGRHDQDIMSLREDTGRIKIVNAEQQGASKTIKALLVVGAGIAGAIVGALLPYLLK